ncbi:unnamed protein product, partial [Mesorhabditis spiculigera]
MQAPQAPVGCPPGLEYLTILDRVVVEQKIEVFEVMTNWETANRYAIHNANWQQAYMAFEEDKMSCARQCCPNKRGYVMHVVDNYGREVMRITRPFKCCADMYWGNETTVEAPPGNVIGRVVEDIGSLGCCSHKFSLHMDGQQALKIDGPLDCCCCRICNVCGDQVFEIKTMQGEKIGDIRKKWTGFAQEYFTDADTFTCDFPVDLDVRMKATILAATFLVDFMFFEDNN